jgi:transcriptional regulator with XRE-family HTH domain
MHDAALATAKRTLGRNMKRLRYAKRLTQKEAAALAGIHWRHWQKTEAGHINPTLASINGIAAALEVDIPALFTERRR